MLFPSPLTAYDVVASPVWFTMVVEKDELVDTCRPYDVAPLDAFQLSVGLAETPVAPFEGDRRVGGDGGGGTVVKDQVVDQALVPPAFVAFTCQ